MYKTFFYLVLFFSSINFSYCDTGEEQKIQKLLILIEQLDAKFERNGDIHTPKEAKEHLESKYRRASKFRNFFGSNPKVTAEEFIEKIASKSSTSGEPYFIIFKDGKKVTTKKWLVEQLQLIKKSPNN